MLRSRYRAVCLVLVLQAFGAGCEGAEGEPDDDVRSEDADDEVSDNGPWLDTDDALVLDLPIGDEPDDRVVEIAAGDVAHLYEVVNSPEYKGYTVRLAPGTYVLKGRLDPGGWGQLVVQPGMTLVGSNTYRDYRNEEGDPEPDGIWDPWDEDADADRYADPATETVIDGRRLEPPDFEVAGCGEDPHRPTLSPSAILLSAGSALRGLTVMSYDHAYASLVAFGEVPGISLVEPNPTFEVTDCVLRDGSVGLSVTVLGCAARGMEASGTVAGNVAHHNRIGMGLYSGYTADVQLSVSLVGNRIQDNGRGLVAMAGLAADRCELVVDSMGNVYGRNSMGGLCVFGQSDEPWDISAVGEQKGGDDNRVDWTSQTDRIVDNANQGGVYIAGGHSHHDWDTEATGNHAEMRIFDTVLASAEGSGNYWSWQRCDVYAFGFASAGLRVDRNNTARLQIEGSTSDSTPIHIDHSSPDDPDHTNQVEVVGGAEAVASQNEGIPGIVE